MTSEISSKSPELIPINEITLSDILTFVFPEDQKNPRTGLRFWVFGEFIHSFQYTKDGKLVMVGGYCKRPHILNNTEINALLNECENNFILSIYSHASSYLSERTEQEIKRKAHPLIRVAMEYTKSEIEDVISKPKLKRGAKEKQKDYMQRVILADRDRRMKELKKATPQISKIRSPEVVFSKSLTTYNKFAKRRDTSNLSNFECVSHLLSRHYHSVAGLEVKHTGIVQNVKLLRPEYPQIQQRVGWDKYCTIRGVGPKSYVKSRNHMPSEQYGIKEEERRPLPTD